MSFLVFLRVFCPLCQVDQCSKRLTRQYIPASPERWRKLGIWRGGLSHCPWTRHSDTRFPNHNAEAPARVRRSSAASRGMTETIYGTRNDGKHIIILKQVQRIDGHILYNCMFERTKRSEVYMEYREGNEYSKERHKLEILICRIECCWFSMGTLLILLMGNTRWRIKAIFCGDFFNLGG